MNYAIASQQVSWLAVHDFAIPRLRKVDDWPMAGSPLWCELGDRDPVKWAALLDNAQHHALRVETGQQHLRDASYSVSAAEDWLSVARIARRRGEFYHPRPWLRRGATQ